MSRRRKPPHAALPTRPAPNDGTPLGHLSDAELVKEFARELARRRAAGGALDLDAIEALPPETATRKPCPKCGALVPVKAKNRVRTVLTVAGELRLTRNYHHCTCGTGFYPRDLELKLPEEGEVSDESVTRFGQPQRRVDLSGLDEKEITGSSVRSTSLELARRLSAFLLAWPLEEVELEAWVFALDGWQRTPPLVQDYDRVFELYVVLVDACSLGTGRQEYEGLDALGQLVRELRERVQFLQTRAADIRLSGQISKLVEVGIERLAPGIEHLANQLENGERRDKALREFATSKYRRLLEAVASQAAASSAPEPSRGEKRLADALVRVVEVTLGGVPSNAV
jgi:hypothetical protein